MKIKNLKQAFYISWFEIGHRYFCEMADRTPFYIWYKTLKLVQSFIICPSYVFILNS